MAKLKEYKRLEAFFEVHMTEGLYLLQFRKCDDRNCCLPLRSTQLPPLIPAPVLQPNGEHYMPFEATYGKISASEKDCPSLVNKEKSTKNAPGFKYLASRVASTIQCCQCRKPRCVFSLTSSIFADGQKELEDIIFSCGSMLSTVPIYTASHLRCSSKVEHAYYSTCFAVKQVCVHCGTQDIQQASLKKSASSLKPFF